MISAHGCRICSRKTSNKTCAKSVIEGRQNLAVAAFTLGRAWHAVLEALAILFQTTRVFATAPTHVMLAPILALFDLRVLLVFRTYLVNESERIRRLNVLNRCQSLGLVLAVVETFRALATLLHAHTNESMVVIFTLMPIQVLYFQKV